MRLFARILFLEGHEALAASAAEALERLVALLGEEVEGEGKGDEGGEGDE